MDTQLQNIDTTLYCLYYCMPSKCVYNVFYFNSFQII